MGRHRAAVELGGQHALGPQFGDARAEHHAGRGLGDRHTGRLGDEGDGPRGARVGLEDVEDVLGERELHVHQAAHADPLREGQGRLAHPLQLARPEGGRRQGAAGVTGVDPGLLDVLHDPAEVHVRAVVDRVDVDLDRVVEEAVDEDRVLRRGDRRPGDVLAEGRVVVDDLHAAATEDVGGPHEDRVADLAGDLHGLVRAEGRPVLGRVEPGLVEDTAEVAPVLREVDGLGRGADDRDARGLELPRQAEGRLPTELDDDAGDRPGLALGVDDLEDVLEGQRLEVEAAARVVVGRDGLGVAVDHDRVVAGLPQGEARVHARVVELDTLTDPVGPRAEDDDGRALARLDLGLLVVGAVVVRRLGGELGRAGVHGLVDRADAEGVPHPAHDRLVHPAQPRDLGVGEAVPLGEREQGRVQLVGVVDLLRQIVDQGHLVEEPRVDLGRRVHLLDGDAGTHRLLDLHEPPVRRHPRLLQEGARRLEGRLVAVPVEGRATALGGAEGLLQGLGEVATDRHRLTDRLHRRRQGRVGGGELLEGEARHLDDDVVERRLEARRSLARDVVGHLVEGVADGHLGGDLRDREAGGLGGERGGARDAGVHLDDDHPAVGRVDRELDVAPAGLDADLADHRDADVTHPLVLAVGERQSRGDRDRVTGVHAHRVEVLDGADDHDVVVGVAHDLELVLLPAEDRLLEEHLGGRAGLEAGAGHPAQVRLVVGEARAEAAHGEGGAHDDRVAELLGGGEGAVQGESDLLPRRGPLGSVIGIADDRARRLGAAALDDTLEPLPVLTELDRLDVGADERAAVLLEDPGVVQGDRGVEGGLPTERGQDGVGALALDDLLDDLGGDRLDVGRVRELGVGHDRRGVGVDEDHADPLLLEDAARLGAGVVELAGLPDDDRAGADDEDALDVVALGHQAWFSLVVAALVDSSRSR